MAVVEAHATKLSTQNMMIASPMPCARSESGKSSAETVQTKPAHEPDQAKKRRMREYARRRGESAAKA
eukprot:scaffold297329_cov27-Tisochrysis_lutea.AAC.3